jgi:hypothetical protein
VLGRPACGKSEFIDFLKHASGRVCRERLHIGRFEEVDDFPWLWEKFQDDEIWAKTEHGRQYTEEYMPGNPGMAPKGKKLHWTQTPAGKARLARAIKRSWRKRRRA